MEKWDAYGPRREKLGYELLRGEMLPRGVRHLVAHMLYYNGKGQVLLQRRSESRPIAPEMWALTGGSALAGETSWQACVRESREEMGIVPAWEQSEIPLSYMTPDAHVDVYLIFWNGNLNQLHLQREEVAQAAWLNREEFLRLSADQKCFWQYPYLPMLTQYLDQRPGVWKIHSK